MEEFFGSAHVCSPVENMLFAAYVTYIINDKYFPLYSTQVPTLIVYGTLDTNLGSQSLESLQNLPNHTLSPLKGAGHACYMDRPEEFHSSLLIYLSKL